MTQFSLVNQAVLALLQKDLFNRNPDINFGELSEHDWKRVFSEARAQSVDIICFDATEGLNIPSYVSSEMLIKSANLFSNNYKIQRAQTKLVKILVSNNIPYVVLKGAASAYFYSDRQKRISGDIDIIVPVEYFELTNKVIINNNGAKENKFNENHVSYIFDGVTVELHHSVSGVPKNKFQGTYNAYFSELFERSIMDCELGFVKPCDSMHGVVILLHTLHHVTSKGLGLRHLCDWACFVNCTHSETYWEDEIIPLLKKTGLFKFMQIITSVCVRYLNIDKPDWFIDVLPETSFNFLNKIFEGGNFGNKISYNSGFNLMTTIDGKRSNIITKIKALINVLNETNHRIYPILNKIPALYPFIMLWRVLRYLVLMLLGKRESLLKVYKHAENRSIQFEEFELFVVDEQQK